MEKQKRLVDASAAFRSRIRKGGQPEWHQGSDGQIRRARSSTVIRGHRRRRKVSIYRSYRRGELPDIEVVSPKEILGPLRPSFCWTVASLAPYFRGYFLESFSGSRRVLISVFKLNAAGQIPFYS